LDQRLQIAILCIFREYFSQNVWANVIFFSFSFQELAAHSPLGEEGQEGHDAGQGWCPESDVCEEEEENQSALE
jgi:hypothetical protein